MSYQYPTKVVHEMAYIICGMSHESGAHYNVKDASMYQEYGALYGENAKRSDHVCGA